MYQVVSGVVRNKRNHVPEDGGHGPDIDGQGRQTKLGKVVDLSRVGVRVSLAAVQSAGCFGNLGFRLGMKNPKGLPEKRVSKTQRGTRLACQRDAHGRREQKGRQPSKEGVMWGWDEGPSEKYHFVQLKEKTHETQKQKSGAGHLNLKEKVWRTELIAL